MVHEDLGLDGFRLFQFPAKIRVILKPPGNLQHGGSPVDPLADVPQRLPLSDCPWDVLHHLVAVGWFRINPVDGLPSIGFDSHQDAAEGLV